MKTKIKHSKINKLNTKKNKCHIKLFLIKTKIVC